VALTQTVVQAILLGIAEILPISPSGHDALVAWAAGWDAPDTAFVIAVRSGALLGIMAYFWQDLADMAAGVMRFFKGKRDAGATLAGQIVLATIPAVGAGFLFSAYVQFDSTSFLLIGWATVAGSVLLLVFDYLSMTVKRMEHATLLDMVLIGLMQVAVFIPGTGRVAVTITMARFLGYERGASARISMLLAIPALIVLNVRDGISISSNQPISITGSEIVGSVVGFIGALIALFAMMSWLRRSSYLPFIVYRFVIGAGILAIAYGWLPTSF